MYTCHRAYSLTSCRIHNQDVEIEKANALASRFRAERFLYQDSVHL